MFISIQNRKIRIAIVGCGRISKNHFGSIEKHAENLELIAVCDINTDTLKAHTEKYSVPGYTRLEEMLQKEKPDILSICTQVGCMRIKRLSLPGMVSM